MLASQEDDRPLLAANRVDLFRLSIRVNGVQLAWAAPSFVSCRAVVVGPLGTQARSLFVYRERFTAGPTDRVVNR